MPYKALLERFEYDADDNWDMIKTQQNFAKFEYNGHKYRSYKLARELIELADNDKN